MHGDTSGWSAHSSPEQPPITQASSTRGRGGASNMQPTSAIDIASPVSAANLRITGLF